jgi:ATP-dependent helicase YprA (DUF1998 family)
MFLLCDQRDLGVAERTRDPHFGVPAVYVYDRYPGGTGLAEALARRAEELFGNALEAVRACPCEEGCPSCVGAVAPAESAQLPPDQNTKVATLVLLSALIQARA